MLKWDPNNTDYEDEHLEISTVHASLRRCLTFRRHNLKWILKNEQKILLAKRRRRQGAGHA